MNGESTKPSVEYIVPGFSESYSVNAEAATVQADPASPLTAPRSKIRITTLPADGVLYVPTP